MNDVPEIHVSARFPNSNVPRMALWIKMQLEHPRVEIWQSWEGVIRFITWKTPITRASISQCNDWTSSSSAEPLTDTGGKEVRSLVPSSRMTMSGFEFRTTSRSNWMTLSTVYPPTPKREIPAESLSPKSLAQTRELARNELKFRTKECPRKENTT